MLVLFSYIGKIRYSLCYNCKKRLKNISFIDPVKYINSNSAASLVFSESLNKLVCYGSEITARLHVLSVVFYLALPAH